ncbi:MAG: TIGR03618 family F420-dependent PPOX class oxidoreductase [Anaerolineales bacterium]|nr:TIGR03618 family F420-dependent PPOX class oxidoreductase [Anaerolineales bacterium]
MTVEVPESHRDLLNDDKRAFAFLATVMPNGSPQVTPVWFDTEGELVRVNTARGRVKDRNLGARPQLAIAIIDPEDPYRYLQIRGSVASTTEEGAREHIDRLAEKYLGTPEYANYQGETRVMYLIRPESVSVMG